MPGELRQRRAERLVLIIGLGLGCAPNILIQIYGRSHAEKCGAMMQSCQDLSVCSHPLGALGVDVNERAWGLETTHASGCCVGIRLRCPGLAVSEMDRHRAFTGGFEDTGRILQTNNLMVEPLCLWRQPTHPGVLSKFESVALEWRFRCWTVTGHLLVVLRKQGGSCKRTMESSNPFSGVE